VKRFRFPLERLLKVKRQLERLAEQRQQQARAAHDDALAQVARAEARLADAAAGGLQALRQAVALGAWQARYEQAAALGGLLEAARLRAAQTEQLLRAADRARVQASTEVEALVYLRRQQWEAHRQEVAARAQELLDEGSMRRWQEARGGAGHASQGDEG
jgi:hypothetical protein